AGCFSDAFAFRPIAGNGSVRSLAVSHRSLDPGWNERAPYAVLLVELDEGPSVLAATDLEPAEIEIGQTVDLSIDRRSDDFVLVWANPRS
ncbi:MAG: OB-fold domain-containing protein, partial [Ilumatobacter fluminis]